MANSPFDSGGVSDVILRSNDCVNFHLHKLILSIASPFFHQLFTLSQPNTPSDTENPIIDVAETSEVLDCLLRFCYPVRNPKIETASQIIPVLEAAKKYKMEDIVGNFSIPLKLLIPAYPRQAYAIACQYGMEGVAREAATHWHSHHQLVKDVNSSTGWIQTLPGGSYVEEMDGLSSGPFFRLLSFLRTGSVDYFCNQPLTPKSPETEHKINDSTSGLVSGGDCLTMREVQGYRADLIVQSTDFVQYLVHGCFLAAASPVLAGMVPLVPSSTREADMKADEATTELPTLQIAESGKVLQVMMEMCYSLGYQSEDSWSLDLAESALAAAANYRMPGLEKAAQRRLSQLSHSDALSVYCVAARAGWRKGAREAAMRACRLTIEKIYSPELEKTPIRCYYALLKFRHDYQHALRGVSPLHESAIYSDACWVPELWASEEVYPELIWLTSVDTGIFKASTPTRMGSQRISSETRVSQVLQFKSTLVRALSEVGRSRLFCRD